MRAVYARRAWRTISPAAHVGLGSDLTVFSARVAACHSPLGSRPKGSTQDELPIVFAAAFIAFGSSAADARSYAWMCKDLGPAD
jgi:hypothetical protein